MSSDAKWYIDQLHGPQREWTDLLLSLCCKYHICWSEATPEEREFMEGVARETLEKGQSKEESRVDLRKTAPFHQTLEERLVAFYGKPPEEIGPTGDKEIDWGPARGNEVWTESISERK